MGFVLYEQKGAIGVITINRPEALNALNSQVLDDLEATFKGVNLDEVHVVAYGTPKVTFKSSNDDILFDDEIGNREAWGENAFEPTMIIEKLKELVG